MGFGKKRDDTGTGGLLGKLKAMPWEREALTVIQPLPDNAALPSDLHDRGTVKGAGEEATK